MRIAIISDIHGNLTALETVLQAVETEQPDALWCLGDVVGYGPHPQECVDLVRARADLCLAGNHDLAVTGGLSLDEFNSDARTAAEWHRQQLSDAAKDWLEGLQSLSVQEDITLAHASPRAPVWEYIDSNRVAAANFQHFDTDLCLVGHSHLAVGWRSHEEAWLVPVRLVTAAPGQEIDLDPRHRWLLNPGSVGQPRDRDPRASFALLDTAARTWIWRRLDYDIAAVDAAIRAAGLPPRLGQRLYGGR